MFFELQVNLGSNFTFVKDQAPKEGRFAIIFGAKIHNNRFSNAFQYFIVNYHNGTYVHIFISLLISCIFYGQKTRELVIMLLLESLLKKSIITNFLIFWPIICKMLPNRIENIYKNILFWYFTVKYWKKWKDQLLSIFAPNMVVKPRFLGARSLTNVKLDLRVTCSFKNINF